MINLKGISKILLLAPILFIGCSSEKVASITPIPAKPEIIKKEKITLDSNQSISKEERLLSSAIFGGEISTETDNQEYFTNTLTSSTLTSSSEWQDFTKEDKILETARKFLGVKYIWAANGPSAFDCSGFTKYVFKKSGISLPRYSGHQANMGKKIKFSQMQKGDLVFFDTTKKFTKKVNHVGIFIGNNKFIHASSGGKKVMITSFSKKKFYKNKFLYARRVINNNESFALNATVKQQSISTN
ncbi:MAG: NLP/P60 family protein [uncultured Sulfurovum sp.]|uniref:NLP/P60 family protein n=1 Tax=uncultured Sulfurovum sp. TaxID=269237 RepID=A0A6S6SVE8_9BACT|nr:MAG: NLP/P60 family protein [uncultured Sulfurovum sp.]